MERYGNLNFESLDTTGAYYSGVKLWSVFVPQSVRECQEYYPQVLELPKEHLKRLRERGELAPDDSRGEEAEERRRSYLEQPVRPVLEVVDDDRLPRLVILGDPGAGKSSLLRFLALRWARITDPNEFSTKPLPLLIELREYDRWECSSNKSLLRYLNEAQTYHRLNQVDLDRLLQRPNAAVFFLDGLDEVFDPARREQVVNDIHRLSNEYPTAPIIVTSRVIGYKPQRLRDAEFRHFLLQDFEPDQVEAFLDHWHEQTFTDPADRAFKRHRLVQAIEESRAIAELAGNPLLLTMMAILNRNQELPRDRAELYEQAARVLLDQWDTECVLKSDPEAQAHDRLPGEGRGNPSPSGLVHAIRSLGPGRQHHRQRGSGGLAPGLSEGHPKRLPAPRRGPCVGGTAIPAQLHPLLPGRRQLRLCTGPSSSFFALPRSSDNSSASKA